MERKQREILCSRHAAVEKNRADWTSDVRYSNCTACHDEAKRRKNFPRHWQRELGKTGVRQIACTGQPASELPSWQQVDERKKAACPKCKALKVRSYSPPKPKKYSGPSGLIPL